MMRIDVGFSSPDPVGQVLLRQVEAIPRGTAERAEVEWFLYSLLAKKAAQEAERLRSRLSDNS